MPTLAATSHEHHEKIDAQIDRLPELADMLDEKPLGDDFPRLFDEACTFITDTLVPHVQAVESNIYPELERLMQNRHSMAPMRREHAELTRLISPLDDYRGIVDAGTLGQSEVMGLRRVIYRLYALLKVHLAEEEEYLLVLQHDLSEAEQDALAKGLEHASAQPL